MKGSLLILISVIVMIGGALSGCSSISNIKKVKILYVEDAASVEPNKFWSDKDLKKRFLNYWGFRLANNMPEAFKIEAPHFQEMANYKRYENYLKGMRQDVTSIKIRKQNYRSQYLVDFYGDIMINDIDIAAIRDTWVFVGGNWYHVLEDNLIFPFKKLLIDANYKKKEGETSN